LDRGEAEAIALAVELKAAALIIDERQGRNKAESVGLKIIGLLGILLEAKSKGLILSVRPLIDELVDKIGFRVHPALYQAILLKAGEL
jgi:predicted nucleic acid-binding protein